MRRVILLLMALVAVTTVSAQVDDKSQKDEKSLVINQGSFREEKNVDGLSNVNVSPIGVDDSRNACARIKMKINRMSVDDINSIEIKARTNNQVKRNETIEYENMLLIEMTAKPETRFYITSPKYGDSNEIKVNLEPNKVYILDAHLKILTPITIITDVEGAAVYLDDIYKGSTGEDNIFLLNAVVNGRHNVRVEYGGKKLEKQNEYLDSKHGYLTFYFLRNEADLAQLTPQSALAQPAEEPKAEIKEEPAAPAEEVVEEPKERVEIVTKSRFEQAIELNGNIGEGMGIGFSYLLGGRIGNNLYLGLGLGATWQSNPYSVEKFVFPLYANVRTYFGKRQCQPYLSLSGGVKFVDDGKQCGLYANPSFGVNIRNKNNKPTSLYIAAGYILQEQEMFDFDKSTLFNGATLSVGFVF
jgi:hypothetical protein